MRCASLALLIAVAAGAAQAAAPVKNWVIVVANNRSLTPGVQPLRYADDDGARWYELLKPIAARASLFTVLDDESQRLFPGDVAAAEPPTRTNVYRRLAQYNVEMAQARAAGFEPVLYFVVVGHGEVAPDGEGYVSLLDQPLRRSDLFRAVIAPSKAEFNHLIIDACNSYLLVSRRGDYPDDRGPSAAAAIRRYVEAEDLDRYPGTGVLLSTSRAKATHEWSVFVGGIFSQEVRSALAGAADVNGDGRVEYSEVHAYVAAANLKVDDPRARLDVFVRPPARDRSRPLIDFAAARFGHYLRLPAASSGHYFLEDARGVRYADFHKSPERPLLLALVDSDYYFLRTGDREARLRLDLPGTVEVADDAFTARTFVARGAIEESFQRHLFEVPYGPAFYRGFAASTGEPVVSDRARAFQPPSAGSGVSRAELERRLREAGERRRQRGLVAGDDPFSDLLVDWAARRLRAGDLREAERAVVELEGRLAEVVIDRAFVARKLERARAAAAAAPSETRPSLAPRLEHAAARLAAGDAGAANQDCNDVLATASRPATR